MKEWLLKGAVPDEERFASQLAAPGYHINPRSKLAIESRADMVQRGEASPDVADALALTLARPVAPPETSRPIAGRNGVRER